MARVAAPSTAMATHKTVEVPELVATAPGVLVFDIMIGGHLRAPGDLGDMDTTALCPLWWTIVQSANGLRCKQG